MRGRPPGALRRHQRCRRGVRGAREASGEGVEARQRLRVSFTQFCPPRCSNIGAGVCITLQTWGAPVGAGPPPSPRVCGRLGVRPGRQRRGSGCARLAKAAGSGAVDASVRSGAWRDRAGRWRCRSRRRRAARGRSRRTRRGKNPTADLRTPPPRFSDGVGAGPLPRMGGDDPAGNREPGAPVDPGGVCQDTRVGAGVAPIQGRWAAWPCALLPRGR